MKIYTRRGDGGETSLWGGGRVPKSHGQVEAYGTVDELNAALGVAVTHLSGPLRERCLKVQHTLFRLGAELAMGEKAREKGNLPVKPVGEEETKKLEEWIDEMEADLPPLKQFILPGGSEGAALLHLARCVCRRAERIAVALETVSPSSLAYLNRLSDFLFVAARYANYVANMPDVPWDSEV